MFKSMLNNVVIVNRLIDISIYLINQFFDKINLKKRYLEIESIIFRNVIFGITCLETIILVAGHVL